MKYESGRRSILRSKLRYQNQSFQTSHVKNKGNMKVAFVEHRDSQGKAKGNRKSYKRPIPHEKEQPIEKGYICTNGYPVIRRTKISTSRETHPFKPFLIEYETENTTIYKPRLSCVVRCIQQRTHGNKQ